MPEYETPRLEEIEIANPESAARICEPGDDARAFLLERSWEYDNEALENLDAPFIAWITSSQPRPEWWPVKDCQCEQIHVSAPSSAREWTALFPECRSSEPVACLCMGRFIE